VSRTRCSVLSAMRSIVRCAAPQSRDPQRYRVSMDPGSAAHRCALRSIRGTHNRDNEPLNHALKLPGGAEAPEVLRRDCFQRIRGDSQAFQGQAGGLCRVRHHVVDTQQRHLVRR
jgi:hypothetical protein